MRRVGLNPVGEVVATTVSDFAGNPSSLKPGVASGIVSHRPAGALPLNFNLPGSTWANMIGCKSSFRGVRILFANYDTANPLTISAKAAPCAKTADDGKTLTYTNVTFNGAASVTIPPATGGPSPNIIPSFVWSDVIQISSIPRTDGGTDSLLYLRTYSTGDIAITYMRTMNQGWLDTTDYIAGIRFTGDAITTPGGTAMTPIQGAAVSGGTGQVNIPYGQIDFYTGGKTARVLAYGDSLTNGSPDASQAWPLAMRKALIALGYPNVSVANAGVSGQKRDTSSTIFKSYAALTKPDIAILWNYSVNGPGDGTSQFPILVSDLEFCRANGIRPIVVTMHPNDTHAALARQFISGWGVLLDVAKLLQTSTSNAAIDPKYTMDGTHLTALGCDTVAAAAAPLVVGML